MRMENCVQVCEILLILVLPVIVTQATVVQNKFKKLDPGQRIIGTIGAEIKARSRRECAVRQVSSQMAYHLDGKSIITVKLGPVLVFSNQTC